MGQSQNNDKLAYRARQSVKTGSFGGSLNLLVRTQSSLPTEYKVKSPPLGRGPFGEIREAYHTVLKQKFLMKIIFKAQFSEMELKDIRDEYQMVKELQHPNIIGMREFFSEERYFYIIMDHFKGRDLYDKVKEENGIHTEKVAVKILRQILQTLRFIHSQNIVYRNLKLENLLYNGRQIAFHDFTSAVKVKKDQKLKDFAGAVHYVAPEVIKGAYDFKCDIWSFGVLMYTLLLGRYPFNGKDEQTVMNNILKLEPDMSSPQPLSADVINLLGWILSKDPSKRPTLQQIEEHSYFARNKSQEIKRMQVKFERVKSYLLTLRIQNQFLLAVYLYFVHTFIANIQGTQLIKEIFTIIDQKAHGKISPKELKTFSKEYELNLSDTDIREIIQNLDFDCSGKIDYEEFLAGCCDRVRLMTDDNLSGFFNKLVGHEDGTLNVETFQKTFISAKKDQIERFFEENGFPKDHELTRTEFVKIMESLI